MPQSGTQMMLSCYSVQVFTASGLHAQLIAMPASKPAASALAASGAAAGAPVSATRLHGPALCSILLLQLAYVSEATAMQCACLRIGLANASCENLLAMRSLPALAQMALRFIPYCGHLRPVCWLWLFGSLTDRVSHVSSSSCKHAGLREQRRR